MLRRVDKILIASVLILMGMSLLSLWATAPLTSISGASITRSIFLRQGAFAAAALVAMLLTLLLEPRHFRRAGPFLYIACVAALVGLLFAGRVVKGARGWIPLGPINIQPAEFAKIAVILTLARMLMYSRNIGRWRGLVVPLVLAGFPTGLVLLQPDLGSALLFVPTTLAMLFAAGARKLHLGVLIGVMIAAAPVGYIFVLKKYQRERLISFVVPHLVSRDARYQKEQSERACAAGGLTGRGLGESGETIPFYVPDRHNDFVFSITAEELGFAGSIFVLLLYGVLFARCFSIARRCREPFGRLVATGVASLLAAQTMINLGMTVGVAPITGVTLPFLSYGGSSLLSCGMMMGLVLGVGARWKPVFSSHELQGASVEIREFRHRDMAWLPREGTAGGEL